MPLDGAWTDEQAGADLGVREAIAGDRGDLRFLRVSWMSG
jgi:hypothetical protein